MNTGKKCVLYSALSLSLATLTGCVDTAGTTVHTDHVGGVSEVLEDSTRLKRRLGVEVATINYDVVNGMKRAHITLTNKSHKRLQLHYRICWFDENGVELDPGSKTYRMLIMEGRDSVTVTGVANNLNAVRSKLRVREADEAM